MNYLWSWDKSKITSGDFNGDGKSDIAILYKYASNRTGLWTFTSNGNSFSYQRVWYSTSWFFDNTKFLSGDVDNDGDYDCFFIYDTGNKEVNIWTLISNKGHFASSLSWKGSSWNWKKIKSASGDFNQDGRFDLAILYKYGDTKTGLWRFNSRDSEISFSYKRVWLSTNWPPE
jgi:hypothetical protein